MPQVGSAVSSLPIARGRLRGRGVRSTRRAHVSGSVWSAWSSFESSFAARELRALTLPALRFTSLTSTRALADAGSLSTAWTTIHAAAVANTLADTSAGVAYAGALTSAASSFYSTMDPAWVAYADAVSDAEAAKSVSRATAHAAAAARWASGGNDRAAIQQAAIIQAQAAMTSTVALATATRDKALHAADAAWVATALPAWTAYETDLTTHAADWVVTAAPAWQSAANAELAASTTFTTAAVPLAVALDGDRSANITAWVSTTSSAEQTYADELADQDVIWVGQVDHGWVALSAEFHLLIEGGFWVPLAVALGRQCWYAWCECPGGSVRFHWIALRGNIPSVVCSHFFRELHVTGLPSCVVALDLAGKSALAVGSLDTGG